MKTRKLDSDNYLNIYCFVVADGQNSSIISGFNCIEPPPPANKKGNTNLSHKAFG